MTRFAAILLSMSFALCAIARTASDFFTSAPDAVVRLIPQSVRLDMVDYYAYGSTRASDNYFGGPARITALSDTVLDFDVDDAVKMQFAVIPAKSDTVIAVVTTIQIPMAESSIKFYDTSWTPVAKNPLVIPEYSAWLTQEGVKKQSDLKPYLPFIPIAASFSPDGKSLVLTNESKEYLTKAQAKEFAPWLIDSKTYDINLGRFTLRK